ncbi:MAG: FAD-dependent oxidoreductase [Clostridiales bacterium]|nr:FAD-dependent oxidoreductase [Clostridiales bacterium]
MIKITQLKIPVAVFKEHARSFRFSEEENRVVKETICKKFRLLETDITECFILRKSVDARKRETASYVYTAVIAVKNEKALLKKDRKHQMELYEPARYSSPAIMGEQTLSHRPVIVGTGPAGLFCGLFLARQGFRPILFERGYEVQERLKAVESYWNGKTALDERCNVQFGEGGAGTFSDGKLNTAIKDPSGRIRKVLETFVEYGAPEEILYEKNPHIGTDYLTGVVKAMRQDLICHGGEVHFNSKVTDLDIKDNQIRGVEINHETWYPCEVAVFAIGHSARDTFSMLLQHGIPMQQKAFAVGVRIQHPQEMIDQRQWGEAAPFLPAANYKLTYQCKAGGDKPDTKHPRGVYSFCMCPGGYVVNASSEKERLVVNGMSNYLRDSGNANSALIVTVTPEDFGSGDVLAGMHFQQHLEEKAYQCAGGAIPVQLWGDFLEDRCSTELGSVTPAMKGKWEFANVRAILPDTVNASLMEAMPYFDQIIPGFARADALISGVESRTSSPVRILRDEKMESAIRGIYPCGEGAGYAGGITSAAVDGIKIYEQIIKTWKGSL